MIKYCIDGFVTYAYISYCGFSSYMYEKFVEILDKNRLKIIYVRKYAGTHCAVVIIVPVLPRKEIRMSQRHNIPIPLPGALGKTFSHDACVRGTLMLLFSFVLVLRQYPKTGTPGPN